MMIFTVSKTESIASQDCNVISIILDQREFHYSFTTCLLDNDIPIDESEL